MTDIVERLNEHCVGHPYAKIEWPHRLLHDARDEIARLRSIVRVNALRWGHTHAEIDEMLANSPAIREGK
jgi:hypothetical protein